MTQEKLTRAEVLRLLQEKYQMLLADGQTRYPQRADFSEREVTAIKAYLGPWPRALEAAGIKPARDDDRKARNREKRIRAKRARRMAKTTDSEFPTGEKPTEQER